MLRIVCKFDCSSLLEFIYFFKFSIGYFYFLPYIYSGRLRSQDFFWVRIYKWNKANPEKLISKGQSLSTIFTDQLLKNNKIRDFRDSCIRRKKSRILSWCIIGLSAKWSQNLYEIAFRILTLIGMRQGTFRPLSFLDQILSAEFL